MNWDHLKALIWLRWRLTRNQFARAGQINAVLAALFAGFMVLGAIGFGIGGLVGGWFAGNKAPAQALLLIWDVLVFMLLVFWASGVMVEVQRSESIDLTKLLHLPVTLHQVFVLNYLSSHFTLSLVLCVPAMLGLCAGLTLAAGPAMALLVPATLSFVFLLTAWTYCLRGWLAALMLNKRRRRTIVLWITILFVLFCQIPNLLVNLPRFGESGQRGRGQKVFMKSGRPVLPEAVVQAHVMVPPGWLGYGAMALKEGNPWPALGATVVCLLFGTLGLMRAYRLTIRFYQGADGTVASAPEPAAMADARPRGRLLVERRLPWLPEDAAALTLATFRSLLRAPEVKMMLIFPLIAVVALTAINVKHSGKPAPEYLTAFAGTIASIFGAFCLTPIMSNVFGLDRNGFCALVLLPIRRHLILFAKNLAFFPFVSSVALFVMLLIKFLAHMSWAAFLVALLQLPTSFLLFCLSSNLIAILAPFRLAPGTLQAKKPKPVVFLAAFAAFIVMPILLLPVLIPPALESLFLLKGWVPWLPINLLGSVVLLAAVVGLYWLLLPWEGRLLQRREQIILREVTSENE